MAKIVSERREITATSLQVASKDKDNEPRPSTVVNLLGSVLVAFFVLGAVTMVVWVFRMNN